MDTAWLVSAEAGEELAHLAPALSRPSSAQLAEISARAEAVRSGVPARLLRRDGRTATIEIDGVLTARPSLLGLLFGGGGTAYSEIVAALDQADRDPEIDEILLSVNSPGGSVAGLFETLDAIQATETPRRVIASAALSAAYALAAAGGKITATSRAAQFGSIGVVSSHLIVPHVVEVTSSRAPNKRPDVTTEAGKEIVRGYLDQLHDLFVDAIATTRGTTVERVNADYGRGSVLLAEQARVVGMVDSLRASPIAAGPIPRRMVAESDDAFRARLSAWVTAGGDDLPPKVLSRRMQQARALLASEELSASEREEQFVSTFEAISR